LANGISLSTSWAKLLELPVNERVRKEVEIQCT